MISKWRHIPFQTMVVLIVANNSKATLQPIPPNHSPRYKPDFGAQSNVLASGRIFVPASNSVASSSLILESHHEIPSVPATRFAAVPTVPVTSSGTHTSLEKLASAVHANPVLAALLISSLLNVKSTSKPVAYNTPEHLPPDPYVALLLSHYGRYIPKIRIGEHGLYAYTAANNIHNTKPFGNYKIYDDST